jgi:diguanylate cyclase (GGDEF)-like protein
MCQTIAQQAAIAIENADLFENAQNEIEERKKIEERLYFDATHDDLTGLSNRKIFLERLEQVCRQPAGAQARYFAVLFMDFDRFKVVNDSLGHASGDQLLIESARRIQECLRPSDLLSRLGGDEFVILLEDIISLEYATRIADRIQDVITQPFFIREREIYITTSIGILFDRASNQHAEDLIRDADIAMYRAKDSGKARYAIFAPEFRSEAISRLEMESALRRALDQQELEVYYQPIFSLQNDQLQGFEALVRWRHPEQGMIAPRKFIPLAEETNLIIQIDRWILREACQQMAVWQDEYPQNPHLTISVNMSGQNLSRPGLVDFIQSVLNACNFPSEQLHLEITESTIMQYAQSTVSLLDNLQRLGVKLHIDDFGTGYSSLSYLHRFPLDALKIDRSFVRNMGENEGSSGLVSTIIKLAHTLNMAVIAEGVETINQKLFLKSMQCEQAQGYYLAKPMDKSSIENILLQKSTIKRAQTV